MNKIEAYKIAEIIEISAPLFSQEKWDNSGFCIGNPNKNVSKLLIALDCSEDIIDQAIMGKYDMIVTHHPLFISPVSQIDTSKLFGRIVEKILKNNITIYSAHTNFDKAATGLNYLIAEKLNLQNINILDNVSGIGLYGNLEYALDPKELLEFIKVKYPNSKVKHSKMLDNKIETIAICSGSGNSLVQKAIDIPAQVFISGDISYHHYFTDNNFMIIDIGHFDSEIEFTSTLFNIISKKIPNFAVNIAKNNNPVYNYCE